MIVEGVFSVSTNKTTKQRFLEKVDMSGECWTWRAATLKSGYGRFRWNGKTGRAHRAAYELFVGPIPEGEMVRHTCDNPPCVKWTEHLITGTGMDNQQDARSRDRHRYGTRNGHALLDECKVSEIRVRRAAGDRVSVIARDFGISVSNVKLIVARKTWTHVV